MADQPIFTDKVVPAEPQTITSPEKKKDDPVSILVGEGRKYKSNEDLAKGYIEADDFIEKLKAENAKLRAEFAREKTRAETLDKLVTRSDERQEYRPDQRMPQGEAQLSAEQIALIVRQEITGRETERTRQENLVKAEALLRKTFGERANEIYKTRATSDELHKVYTELASVSPDEFLKLFQNASPQTVAPQVDVGGSHNTGAIGDPNNSGRVMDPGTKEYYEALRKKDRSKYYSQAVQLQMTRAAEADPDKFFGRKR